MKVIEAKDESFNRKTLERKECTVLLSPEKNTSKDTIKKIDSGLNEVLARIASKNNISIGIDISDISSLPKDKKAIRLTKIIQNIVLCRKSKTRMLIKGPKEASHLMLSLGASTKQAKEAVTQDF